MHIVRARRVDHSESEHNDEYEHDDEYALDLGGYW